MYTDGDVEPQLVIYCSFSTPIPGMILVFGLIAAWFIDLPFVSRGWSMFLVFIISMVTFTTMRARHDRKCHPYHEGAVVVRMGR